MWSYGTYFAGYRCVKLSRPAALEAFINGRPPASPDKSVAGGDGCADVKVKQLLSVRQKSSMW